MHPCCFECAADPLAPVLAERMQGIGDTSAGECDSPVTVVTPAVIDRLRARVDPDMRSTNEAVERCQGLSELERATWRGFYGSWRAWADEPVSWFGLGLGSKWDMGCAMSRELSAWKDKLRAECEVGGPSNVARPREIDLSPVKWVAAAVIAAAGVYALRTVWP